MKQPSEAYCTNCIDGEHRQVITPQMKCNQDIYQYIPSQVVGDSRYPGGYLRWTCDCHCAAAEQEVSDGNAKQ